MFQLTKVHAVSIQNHVNLQEYFHVADYQVTPKFMTWKWICQNLFLILVDKSPVGRPIVLLQLSLSIVYLSCRFDNRLFQNVHRKHMLGTGTDSKNQNDYLDKCSLFQRFDYIRRGHVECATKTVLDFQFPKILMIRGGSSENRR